MLTGTVGINGIIQLGNTLTAMTGTLDGSGTITHQWRRGTTNISGATSSSYILQTVDVGSTITLRVTRLNNSGWVDSSPTIMVPPGSVSIPGTTLVGQVLTVDTTNYGGSGTFNYQWMRGSTPVGTNSASYTVQFADASSAISVIVSRGSLPSVTSNSTAIVPQPVVNIIGEPVVGQTFWDNFLSMEAGNN
jgi:hypothetical protein